MTPNNVNARMKFPEVILQRRYQYVTMSCVVKTNSAELTQSNFVGQLLRLEVCLDKLKTIAVDRS